MCRMFLLNNNVLDLVYNSKSIHCYPSVLHSGQLSMQKYPTLPYGPGRSRTRRIRFLVARHKRDSLNQSSVSLGSVLRMLLVFINSLGCLCCHLVVAIYGFASTSQVMLVVTLRIITGRSSKNWPPVWSWLAATARTPVPFMDPADWRWYTLQHLC